MKGTSICRGVLVAIMTAPVAAVAFAQGYVPNYVYIGSFDSGYGTVEVSQDLNQHPDPSDEGISAAIKAPVPTPSFYSHSVTASDYMSPGNGDANPTYFSELVVIDCDRRLVHQGHAVYYNSEGQMVADHNYGGAAAAIEPNTLSAVLAKRICGR